MSAWVTQILRTLFEEHPRQHRVSIIIVGYSSICGQDQATHCMSLWFISEQFFTISGIDKSKIILKFELDLLSSKTIAGSDLEVLVYFFNFSSSFELELLSTIVFIYNWS